MAEYVIINESYDQRKRHSCIESAHNEAKRRARRTGEILTVCKVKGTIAHADDCGVYANPKSEIKGKCNCSLPEFAPDHQMEDVGQ